MYDQQGIHNPVFSFIPKIYTQISSNCRMKANNKGDLLVLTNYYREDIVNLVQSKFYNYYHLYNFNQNNGIVTFAKKIDEFYQSTPLSGTGPDSIPYNAAECSFSPNDSILYINTLGNNYYLSNNTSLLFQYQIFNNNISSTRRKINPINLISAQLDMMQLAPNGKIYVGSWGNSYLACIENPNLFADACNFNMKYMALPFPTNSISISNVLYEYKKVSFIAKKENCQTLRFTKDCDTSFVTFKWYFGDGDSSNGTSVAHNYNTKGKFIVKLKATTAYDYSVWYSQEIFTTDIPQINFTTNNSIGCQYIAVKFNDLTITDTITQTVNYIWDFGDGTTQVISLSASSYKTGIGSISHIYKQSGKYTVKLIFNNGFCENTIEKTSLIEIMPAPKPGILASIKSGCSPVSIRFRDTLSFNIVSKEYDFGNGVLVSSISNHPLDTMITFSNEGNYFIRQKLTGTTGCITEDTLTIKLLRGVDQKFKPEIYYASYINDSIIEVAWNPVDHSTNYQLEINSKKIELSSNQTKYELKDLRPSQPNLFQITASDTCGNLTSKSEVSKTIYLNAELIEDKYILIQWTPYDYWKNGVLGYDLERKIGNSNDWQKIAPTNKFNQFSDALINFNNATSCKICYRVIAYEDGNNLKESRSNMVCTYLKPTIFVPNAFSPNNDGLNDNFKPIGMGIDYFEIFIYDRWGGFIFEIKSDSIGWDGKLANGSLAPEGVYLYEIQSQSKTVPQFQKVFNIKGSVILNR